MEGVTRNVQETIDNLISDMMERERQKKAQAQLLENKVRSEIEKRLAKNTPKNQDESNVNETEPSDDRRKIMDQFLKDKISVIQEAKSNGGKILNAGRILKEQKSLRKSVIMFHPYNL